MGLRVPSRRVLPTFVLMETLGATKVAMAVAVAVTVLTLVLPTFVLVKALGATKVEAEVAVAVTILTLAFLTGFLLCLLMRPKGIVWTGVDGSLK